jgi:hypothetical protein
MRWIVSLIIALLIAILVGCQGQSSVPTTPTLEEARQNSSAKELWGLYDVWFDNQSSEFKSAPLRGACFAANVTKFLDGPPSGLGIKINNINGNVFDIDVSLKHPFPGLDQYTGFDVMGVFIGEGSQVADWNSELRYAGLDDQQLLNADGYTRWFNPTEFNGGMPLLSYNKGKMSTPGYTASATLCPYKYYADNLDKGEDLWSFLTDPTYTDRGAFRPNVNTRNYVIQFPQTVGIKFNYAVVANWEPNLNTPAPPVSLNDFPPSANAQEAIGFKIDTTASTLFWNSTDGGGGKLIADIAIFDWSATASGAMAEYGIVLSSSMLATPYTLTPSEMTPVGSGNHYYMYHVEMTPDLIQKNDQTIRVVVEYPGTDYSNQYGVLNDAQGPLEAVYVYDFTIPEGTGNQPPVIESGVDGPTPVTECQTETYSVTASDPDGDPLVYTWSVVPDGQPDNFNINGDDQDINIKWPEYGDGIWSVNCRISDIVNPPVIATPLVVTVTDMVSCCPNAPNAAYDYTLTPTTQDWNWAYTKPATSGDVTGSASSIDMDFLNDDTNRLVLSCRTLHQIACITPVLYQDGINYTQFVTGVDAMSIDVTPGNRMVYVKFDNSVMTGITDWRDLNWPTRTKAAEGADSSFHVFDVTSMAEVGSGFDVGAKVQAVAPDEYGTIWLMDANNEMHCFEESGATYAENTSRNFDMDTNGSNMQGLVYDVAIDFYNECFYILTNATVNGNLYRVECDGAFQSNIDGNPNPMQNVWNEKCTDKADIVIDNYDSSGAILDGEQDAQILCVANIEMPYNIYASKIGISRVNAALGNKVWYLFEGVSNVGYGATASAINGKTNTMFTKCGPPYGNQFIVQKIFVPAGQWY